MISKAQFNNELDIIISNAIRNYAECGVDYISTGALRHSVYNMDLSLKVV